MPSLRLQRVRELLKQAISEAIRREIPIQEAGLVSVNDVAVSGDLRQATVYTSILGNPRQQAKGLEMLHQNRVRIQQLMAKAVVIKYTPQLRFVVDDSVARGNRVLHIMDELEKQTPALNTAEEMTNDE